MPDDVENPIGDGKSFVAVELRSVEGERRNAIAEREQENDDEDGALGDAPKMNTDGGAVFGEWRVVKASIRFEKDKEGKVTKAVHSQNGATIEAPKTK